MVAFQPLDQAAAAASERRPGDPRTGNMQHAVVGAQRVDDQADSYPVHGASLAED
jgi:hypothetical protein